jgi:hypothetical protein
MKHHPAQSPFCPKAPTTHYRPLTASQTGFFSRAPRGPASPPMERGAMPESPLWWTAGGQQHDFGLG